jgi:hypothetical protein
MSRKKKAPTGEVEVDELKNAILAVIVEKFDGRELTLDTARMALSQVAYDLTVAHLREVAAKGGKRGEG